MQLRNFARRVLWSILQTKYVVLNSLFHFEEHAIFCYHSISTAEAPTAVSGPQLERQLQAIKNHGYAFVSLADTLAWSKGGKSLPRKSITLTFDDGYADFETAALPILEKFGAPATLFVVGEEEESRSRLVNNIPLLDKGAVERLGNHPFVELGYHSQGHPNLAMLDTVQLEAEVRAPFPARFFAYPGGKHSSKVAQALKGAGYTGACTIRPVLVKKGQDPYYLPRSVILRAMPLAQVVAHATKAGDWYYAATH